MDTFDGTPEQEKELTRELRDAPRTETPEYLSREDFTRDGNAFSMIGTVRHGLRRAGRPLS